MRSILRIALILALLASHAAGALAQQFYVDRSIWTRYTQISAAHDFNGYGVGATSSSGGIAVGGLNFRGFTNWPGVYVNYETWFTNPSNSGGVYHLNGTTCIMGGRQELRILPPAGTTSFGADYGLAQVSDGASWSARVYLTDGAVHTLALTTEPRQSRFVGFRSSGAPISEIYLFQTSPGPRAYMMVDNVEYGEANPFHDDRAIWTQYTQVTAALDFNGYSLRASASGGGIGVGDVNFRGFTNWPGTYVDYETWLIDPSYSSGVYHLDGTTCIMGGRQELRILPPAGTTSFGADYGLAQVSEGASWSARVYLTDGAVHTLALTTEPRQSRFVGFRSSGAPISEIYLFQTSPGPMAYMMVDNVEYSVPATPPVAADDAVSVTEDSGAAALAVLANDTDINGDPLTISSTTQPQHGAVSISGDGQSVVYTPAPNYNGPDSFTYTVSDPGGGTGTATVAIDVTPVNDAPSAQDDAFMPNEDASYGLIVRSNDTDADGDTLIVSAVTQPQHGTAAVSFDGQAVNYTPAPNYNGPDSFTYTVSDGNGGSDTATVTITVRPVNDLPAAVPDTFYPTEHAVFSVSPPGVLVNDTDIDGDTLTASIVSGPSNGTLVLHPNGYFAYTPNPNFHGVDTFVYQANDGSGGTATATVTFNVAPVNDAPTAEAGPDQTVECAGATTPVRLDGSGSADIDGDNLAYTWSENGTPIASGVSPTIDLSHGSHTLILTVTDGNGGTATDTVIVVVADTTAPALSAVTATPNELKPADRRMVLVTLSYTVSDACDAAPAISLSVTSNEATDEPGAQGQDWEIVDSRHVRLRAERSGKGSGRIYTITVTATDASGNRSSRQTTVTVPKSRGR